VTYKVLGRQGVIKATEEDFSKVDAQYIESPLVGEDDVIKYAHDADAVIVGPTEPYTRRVIEALTKCKVISRVGIGCDNIDIYTATEYGIPVAYVPDASITEVSDHAMALLLCFSRNLIPISQAVREGGWQPGRNAILPLRKPLARLDGQTVGLVGLGRIGSAFCKKAKVFDLKAIVYDPYAPAGVIEELGAEEVTFERILAESDYISLHAPLTEETRHLFGLEQFKKMKRTAYLINTARGGLIDEGALATALAEGHIAGAGLDVTDPEPPKADYPLLKMENVIITAHTAFYSQISGAELSRRAVEAVQAALSGQCPRDLANPEVKEKANYRLNR